MDEIHDGKWDEQIEKEFGSPPPQDAPNGDQGMGGIEARLLATDTQVREVQWLLPSSGRHIYHLQTPTEYTLTFSLGYSLL